ncbi:MAG: (2Fe-2S)-binding protein [Chloroflexota bacterium]
MSVPVWERLRAPDRRPLRVAPLRRIELELLRVVDGDLPDLDGATVFDAWTDPAGYALRAALLTDADASPYLVRATRLEIVGSDGRLEALLGRESVVASAGELERLACACRGISADAVYRAIGAGWSTVDQLKRSSRIAFGECQGRRCVPWLAERLELSADDPRAQVRARPPLVPVPASVLAAFAED